MLAGKEVAGLFTNPIQIQSTIRCIVIDECLSFSLLLLLLSYPSQASCLWRKWRKYSKLSLKTCCSTLTQKTAFCNLPLGIVVRPPTTTTSSSSSLPLKDFTCLFCNCHVNVRQSSLPGIEVLLNKWSSFGRGAENVRCSPCAGAGACCKLGGFFKDRQSSFAIHAQ